MSARDDIAAHFTSDTLVDQLLDAYRAEVLAEYANPANAHTIYAERSCSCDETPHPTWCPASIPTDARINEIRQGTGGPITPRELAWLRGAADRHELHVIAARDGHWPLTEDLAGALLLVSQYLAAAVAVIDRAEQVGEKASATASTATPSYNGRLTTLLDAIRTHEGRWNTRRVQQLYRAPGIDAPQRGTARRDLHALHSMGHLTLCGPENGRYYLLARKDVDA